MNKSNVQLHFEVQVYQCTSISTFTFQMHICELVVVCQKKATAIQNGYRKLKTHARVLNLILIDGASADRLAKKGTYHSVWLQDMGNSCTSVFPNTRAWEEQERNKTKKQTKMVRRETWVWKEAKRARIKEVLTAYHILTKIQ